MHTGDIVETNPDNGIFSTFGHAVSLTFDLYFVMLAGDATRS